MAGEIPEHRSSPPAAGAWRTLLDGLRRLAQPRHPAEKAGGATGEEGTVRAEAAAAQEAATGETLRPFDLGSRPQKVCDRCGTPGAGDGRVCVHCGSSFPP